MSVAVAANKKQVIKREWMTEDPILRDLRIFRLHTETNYPQVRHTLSECLAADGAGLESE
jgi:hypothetical protein